MDKNNIIIKKIFALAFQNHRKNNLEAAEKLYRKDKIYDIFINIKYNYSPVIKGRGSAIFLHLSSKNYKPTKGCIAVKKKDILKIIPLIKKNTKISIR